MIDSHPSASRPSNARAVKRRPAKHRALAARADSGQNARWKVQLELAPAEIALVYKQGLARGAEVCRQGTHEWRPLVTTPELRAALAAGRGLITLAKRPAKKPASIAPPPPAVVKREPAPELMQTFSPVVTPLEVPATLAAVQTLPPPRARASSFAWLVRHARPAELALVAGVAVLLTWTVSALTHHNSVRVVHERVALSDHSSEGVSATGSVTNAASFGPGSSIPVVAVSDLPVEGEHAARGAAVMSSGAGARSPRLSGMRGELARALGNAARAAQSCGEGPVNTQVVATFAPSGVARSIHFGAGAPPAGMRSCVLIAVARARISPFEGDPVTVSKTLRW